MAELSTVHVALRLRNIGQQVRISDRLNEIRIDSSEIFKDIFQARYFSRGEGRNNYSGLKKKKKGYDRRGIRNSEIL